MTSWRDTSAAVEGPEAARGAALADLHRRMRRAVRGLGHAAELPDVLAHLLRVVGGDSNIERVVVVTGRDDPRELAAAPGPTVGLDANARLGALVHRVHEVDESASDPGETDLSPGNETARSRVGVPSYADGRIMAVVVGETAPGAGLDDTDEAVVEAMAMLLTPLLLVQQRLEDARELDRLRSDFISRVSHELRTPLTIITGFAGTLGTHDDSLSREQRHAMLDRIVTASVRLEHLVEEVLSLASVDAGLAEPEPRLVPVRDVVDLAIHDRGGTGRVAVNGASARKVVTDPEIARVVLGSVIENALQHGDVVRVTIEQAGDGARVVVEDDGPGVPPELGSRVFERFVRGDDRSPGMGLGLAIARRMAELIGAALWYEDVAPGARFVVELPSIETAAGTRRRDLSGRPQSP